MSVESILHPNVGDTVWLATQITINGIATQATVSVVVQVLDPDGVYETPTVPDENPSTGLYRYALNCLKHGTYTVTFTVPSGIAKSVGIIVVRVARGSSNT